MYDSYLHLTVPLAFRNFKNLGNTHPLGAVFLIPMFPLFNLTLSFCPAIKKGRNYDSGNLDQYWHRDNRQYECGREIPPPQYTDQDGHGNT